MRISRTRSSDLHRSPNPPFHGFCRGRVARTSRRRFGHLSAADAKIGQAALDAFAQSPWAEKYPATAGAGAATGSGHSVLRVPKSIRKIIYTQTPSRPELQAAPAIRTRGHFPSDDAAAKLLYLVSDACGCRLERPPREWFEAKTQYGYVQGRGARMTEPASHTKIPIVPQ